jgi:hypothetical protein
LADGSALPPALAAVDRDGALAEAAANAAAGAAGGFSEPFRASAPTRRGFFGLGTGAAALGFAGRARAAGSKTGSQQDIAILNYALSLEYLQFLDASPTGASACVTPISFGLRH